MAADQQSSPQPAGKNRPVIDPKAQVHLGYWLLALALMFVLQGLWSSYSNVQTVPYSAFQT